MVLRGMRSIIAEALGLGKVARADQPLGVASDPFIHTPCRRGIRALLRSLVVSVGCVEGTPLATEDRDPCLRQQYADIRLRFELRRCRLPWWYSAPEYWHCWVSILVASTSMPASAALCDRELIEMCLRHRQEIAPRPNASLERWSAPEFRQRFDSSLPLDRDGGGQRETQLQQQGTLAGSVAAHHLLRLPSRSSPPALQPHPIRWPR